MAIDKPCVLVTGAGQGLGRAVAKKFRSEGYHVVATDYNEALLEDLQGLESYTTAKHDVASIEDAAAVAEKISTELGRLDVIVNNAGVIDYYPLVEAPPQRTINAYMINTMGPLIVTQACLDLLAVSKGCVVNIASESSPFRPPFQYYQASKMALEALSDVMRRELGLIDAHVAIIRPGAIQTALLEKKIENPVANSRFQSYFERFAKQVAESIPKNRSQPSEVAALIHHAATDPARKPMYKINNSFKFKVMSWLPLKLMDKLLAKELGG